MLLKIICIFTYNVILVISTHKKDYFKVTDLHYNKFEEAIGELVVRHYDNFNGWSSVVCIGQFSDHFYKTITPIGFPIVKLGTKKPVTITHVIPNNANTFVIFSFNLQEFYKMFEMVLNSPYWNPKAKIFIFIYNSASDNKMTTAKIFYSLWWNQSINAIIIETAPGNKMSIKNFTPYVSEKYKLTYSIACRSKNKLSAASKSIPQMICEDNCNTSNDSMELRIEYLRTCISFEQNIIDLPTNTSDYLALFQDKTKNLNRYKMITHVININPFSQVTLKNGKVSISGRDAELWNSLAELQNFELDFNFTISKDTQLSYKNLYTHITDLANKKVDIMITPIFINDLTLAKVNFLHATKFSGWCIISHKPGFVENIFGSVHVNKIGNFGIIVFAIWLTFYTYICIGKGRIGLDQMGLALLRTVKAIRGMSEDNLPNYDSFRIFYLAVLWSFFVTNFLIEGQIVSFLSVRGKEKNIETFDDILEKGYKIQGLGSKTAYLPEDEAKYVQINSKIEYTNGTFNCVDALKTDPKIFCLLECGLAEYLENSYLDFDGQPYLHVVTERLHSYYLAPVLPDQSPLLPTAQKHVMRMVDSGLIQKWEGYKFYSKIIQSNEVQKFKLKDIKVVYATYALVVLFTIIIFILEHLVAFLSRVFKKKNRTQFNIF